MLQFSEMERTSFFHNDQRILMGKVEVPLVLFLIYIYREKEINISQRNIYSISLLSMYIQLLILHRM